jgi:hypothetical protein
MNAARIRIGRVRMKNGGADVRVLHKERDYLSTHMMEWANYVLSRKRKPDAYAAIALWLDPKTPGRPSHDVTFLTTVDALPAPVLVRMAGDYLVSEQSAWVGRCYAVEAMGHEPEDWSPDNAG